MPSLSIIVFDSGKVEIKRGSLIDCPIEFFSPAQIRYYQTCPIGWSRCPLDYHVYSSLDAMGKKIVVPGVIVPSERSPRRKFPSHGVRFEKKAIQTFLDPHLSISEQIRSQRDIEFKNLTHDLRAISTEIYHTAVGIKERVGLGVPDSILGKVESVLAAQQMMSVRLDIVDYESGDAANRPRENIAVSKKVEKVYKCFGNKLRHRRIDHHIDGTSFGLTYGPPIFEIVPFVIIENAIKYSPMGGDMVIRFEENENDIVVRFDSFGPRIKDSEKERIFDQNFRGEAAASGRTGSGIGLYAAKTLVEQHFGGKIFVNQLDERISYNASPLFKTRFTVVLPRILDAIRPAVRQLAFRRLHRGPSFS